MLEDGTATEPENQDPTTLEDEKKEAEAKFTDADMAKLRKSYEGKLNKKAQEARKAAVNEMLSELGVDSSDDLITMIETAKAARSETQVASDELKLKDRKMAKIAEQLKSTETKLAEIVQQNKKAAVRNQITKVADKLNAHTEDVYARMMLEKTIDVDDYGRAFVKDEFGDVDETVDLETAVKNLIAENSHLRRNSGIAGAGSQSAPASVKEKAVDFRDRGQMNKALANVFAESGFLKSR